MDYSFYNKWAPWMMDQLQEDFKISLESSAAVVGNGGAESGGFQSLQEKKPLVPGSRGGFGVFQWTGPRRRLFEAYCSRNKLDPTDMETNYKFLFVELKGSEGKGGKVLQRVEAAKTLESKTEVFMKEFLRPGIPHLDSRIVWAKRAMAAWSKYSSVEEIPSVPVQPTPKPIETPVAPLPDRERGVWEIILDIILALFRKK